MKKIAPALGIAGAILLGLGVFFKMANKQGAGLILLIGLFLITVFLLPWLGTRKWKELNRFQRLEQSLGVLGTMFLLNGMMFKIQHWPGGSISVTLGVFLFIFGFLPLQLHMQWREAETRLQKSYALIRFLAIFLILLGFTFKTMHWPGAQVGLAVGSIVLPLFLALYFTLRIRKQGKLPFLLSDLLITVITYVTWIFINMNQVSEEVAGGYRLLEDQYIQMNAGIESANKTIYHSVDSLTGDAGGNLKASIHELQQLGENCKKELDSIKEGFYHYLLLEYYKKGQNHLRLNSGELGDPNKVMIYFYDNNNALAIKNIIDEYRDEIIRIARENKISTGSVGLGLSTEDKQNGSGYSQTWIDYIFEHVPAGSVIVNLSMLKQMVLLSESTVINGLIGQMDLSGEALLLQEIAARESEKAIQTKENEIARVRQEQEIQSILLEQSQMVVKQNRIMAIGAFAGVALVLVLLSISTRANLRKQRANKELASQKEKISEANEELNLQNEEIAAQRDEIEAQRDLVYKQKTQIERTHKEISASIDYATRLQGSILPDDELLNAYFSEHFILFLPKQKVSGDFYWWTEEEGHLVLAAADCTGHGVPGAFMSLLGVSLLRETVTREYIIRPDVILQRLRKEVIRSLNQTGSMAEQKDGMDIALISLHPENLHCQFAGANNPLYHVRGNKLTEYKGDRMPISYYDRMDKFTNYEFQLEKGDVLYLFSDGFADQFGGPLRKKFKYRALKELLRKLAPDQMENQKQSLEQSFMDWKGNNEQVDDVVILGLRI